MRATVNKNHVVAKCESSSTSSAGRDTPCAIAGTSQRGWRKRLRCQGHPLPQHGGAAQETCCDGRHSQRSGQPASAFRLPGGLSQISAVDIQRMARNERRGIGAQPDDGLGNLGGLS